MNLKQRVAFMALGTVAAVVVALSHDSDTTIEEDVFKADTEEVIEALSDAEIDVEDEVTIDFYKDKYVDKDTRLHITKAQLDVAMALYFEYVERVTDMPRSYDAAYMRNKYEQAQGYDKELYRMVIEALEDGDIE